MSRARDVANSTTALNVDGTIKLDGNYPVGTSNVALGDTALDSNVSGNYNTAIGADALTANTASNNTAVGYQAGYANTTGTELTFFGYKAGANTTGSYNTYVGSQTGITNTSGTGNTGVGWGAISSTSGATDNTAVGYGAGSSMTTGSKNTIIGRYNGNQGGLDIRTSSNNIVLSDGDGNPRGIFNNNGAFLVGTVEANLTSGTGHVFNANGTGITKIDFTTGNQAHIYNNNNATGTGYSVEFRQNNVAVGAITAGTSSTSYGTTSDYRLKENVVELTGATDRLKQIPVHRFNFIADPDKTVDGFLAHEVQAIVPEAITGTKDEVDADGNPVYQGIDQSKLVPLLVATIKELEARIAALEAN